MAEKTEAVLEAGSFDGFDDDGKRCRFKHGDIVKLSRTQLLTFSDQFQSIEEGSEAPPNEPSGEGAGGGSGGDDDGEEENT